MTYIHFHLKTLLETLHEISTFPMASTNLKMFTQKDFSLRA